MSTLDILLMIFGLLVILGSVIFTRKFIGQIGATPASAASLLHKIATGDLSTNIQLKPGDTTSMMAACKRMSDTLAALQAEMNSMRTAHSAGNIDVVVDTSKFYGAYRALATGVNILVNEHIVVNKKVMSCIQEISAGKLDTALEPFPGKQAFINHTVESLRGNLKAFVADIQHLSQEHDAGASEVMMNHR